MDIDVSTTSSNVSEKCNGNQSNPLEQFFLLAKGAKGLAATQLVKQVLEAPNVYVFAELFDYPNIAELKDNPDHKKYYDLLQLFAYGVYEDYLKNAGALPELSPAMLTKLQHLTLVSLATGQKSLPLAEFGTKISVTSTRKLEDLIIEAIYAGIISGRIDQKNGVLEVDYALGRDIKLDDLDGISATLQEWCQKCDSLLTNVDLLITEANNTRDENLRHKIALDQEVTNIKASIKAQIQDEEPLVTDSREERKRPASCRKTVKGSSKFWQKN